MASLARGSKGWRSDESARLPPMWPGFKSRRRRHMWVEFVVGSLPCSERFFSGYSGFPLSSKTSIFKFQFDQESGRRGTTLWMCYLQIIIYLFIYVSFLLFEINTLASVWKSKLRIRIKKDGRTNFAQMFTHFRSCWFSETANKRGSCDNFT